MNDSAILEKLKTILRSHTAIKVEVTKETALLGHRVLDSMDFMNYLVAVETDFGVTLSDEDIAQHHLGIVGNMVTYLGERTV